MTRALHAARTTRAAPAARAVLTARTTRAAPATLIALLALTAVIAPLSPAPAAADADAAPVHHRVQIDGTGGPTVIFEAGLGDTLEVWRSIQPRVAARCVRTFAYNRAGYADSDPALTARDAAAIVGELRDELQRRHVTPPYVLVGHSLGGLYMQYFARNFPADVAGLVLIDSTHWRQGMTLDASADTAYQSRTAVTLFMPLIMRSELRDSGEAGREVAASPAAPAIPTIVLSSTRSPANATPEQQAQAVALQNEIAADFPGSRHDFVENSGHYIQREQPDRVVAAIRELAGCDRRGAGSGAHAAED
jgi:pimeloyl-ACP methyl ester carboxylesterase